MTPQEIKQARLDAGLTQTQAAELIGVHMRTFQKWELGIHRMPIAAWKLFSQVCETSQDKGNGA